MPSLEPKQRRFCQEYVVDMNASAAAVRAGYSSKTAKEQGYRLLTNVLVQEEVQRLKEKAAKRAEITADMVIAELAKIGFSNIQDFVGKDNSTVDLSKIESARAAAVSGVKVTTSTTGMGKSRQVEKKVEFRLHDKRAALENLGKHLGVFEKDNQQKNKKVKIIVTTKKNGS